MPGLIEADDGKLYVVKMHGAGQGPLALVSEVVTGELARLLGLAVPELVLVEQAHAFGRQEPDPEIRSLLRASVGLNAGLAFLKGAVGFDLSAGDIAEEVLASLTVWLDAFTLNVDRTPRNPNLLRWRGGIWLIDHGASLYFHHNWPAAEAKVLAPFEAIRDHVLLPWATDISSASQIAHSRLNDESLCAVLDAVPDAWFAGQEMAVDRQRGLYHDFLRRRLQHSFIFEEEIQHARTSSL
jgi:HipA-like protein